MEGGETENIYQEPKRLSDFLRESDDDEWQMEINLKTDHEFGNTSFKPDLGLYRLSRFLQFGRRRQTKKEEKEKKEMVKKGNPVEEFSPELCNLSENKCEKGDARCFRMDQMEAELEIELGRMGFTLSEGSSSPEQQHQIPGEWIDFCENLSSDMEQSDESETWQYECSQSNGVSPYELERKLHELLHQRQQERIEELEYQLEFLERKLLEKESETQQWNGIAITSSKCK